MLGIWQGLKQYAIRGAGKTHLIPESSQAGQEQGRQQVQDAHGQHSLSLATGHSKGQLPDQHGLLSSSAGEEPNEPSPSS